MATSLTEFLEQILVSIQNCLSPEITDSCVASGSALFWDCAPILRARIAGLQADSSQTVTYNSDGSICRDADLAATVEFLIIRCVPTLDKNGHAPNCADLSAAAVQADNDLFAALGALKQVASLGSVNVQAISDGGFGGWLISLTLPLKGICFPCPQ